MVSPDVAVHNWKKVTKKVKKCVSNAKVDETIYVITLLALFVPIINYVYPIKSVTNGGWIFTVMHILVGMILVPYIIMFNPELSEIKWQLIFALIVTVLDWVSLLEDKSRYSESKEFCLSGKLFDRSCRKHALYTGLLAHGADTAGIYMIVKSILTSNNSSNSTLVLFHLLMLSYLVMGCLYIYFLTADNGPSDIREYTKGVKDLIEKAESTDEDNIEKKEILDVLQNDNVPRLWKDRERGILNLLITYLGIFASWQVIFNNKGEKCGFIPGDNLLNPKNHPIWKFFSGGLISPNDNENSIVSVIGRLLLFAIPTFTNLLNTSYQFAAPTNDLGLPTTNMLFTTK